MSMAKTKSKDSTKIKRRVWELQSQCEHDGKEIWTPEIVTSVIEKLEAETLDNGKPALKRWAWCMHDKDRVLEENIEQLHLKDPTSTLKIGDPRPAHIHLALEFENAVYNTHLQKISGLPIEFVRKPNAKYNQFMAIATYLSHCRAEEQAKGKHQYPVEEIHYKGFDYVEEVRKYLAVRDKKESEIRKSPRHIADMTINMIERGELSVEEAKERIKETEGFSYFLRYEKEFRAARTEFIKRHYEMKPRINYYIYGASGSGKSTMSRYLAKSLFPDLQDFECYYTAGAVGVRFDDYEYQPVIIWEDVRAEDLLKEYKREGILNLMELSPKKRSYNIKYGKVTLTHQVNIFTGPVPFEEFAAKLMGAYSEDGKVIEEEKDKEQALRRFPVIINVLKNEIVVFANSRLFENTKASEYKKYARALNVDIAKLNANFAGAALDEAFRKITAPIAKLHNDFMEKMSGDKITDEDDAPFRIEVVEGYQDVEDSYPAEWEKYISRCKCFLDKSRLGDGTFGPYVSETGWELGDELDGEYEGIFCPFTFEQWKDMGRPAGYLEEDLYDVYHPEDQGASGNYYEVDKFNADSEENHQAVLDYNARLLELRPLVTEYKEALERGENPDLPEGVTEQDVIDCENAVTDEEIEAIMNMPDEDFKEPLPEWFDEYYQKLCEAQEKFLVSKAEEDLMRWVHALIVNPLDEAWILSDARKYMLDSWREVKDACIKSGLAEDEKSWYRLYQRLNCM